MSYSYFFKYFSNDEINTVFEIGARWGLDSKNNINHLNPHFYHIFEANPDLISIIHNNLSNYKNIKITNAAITDKDNEEIIFNICKSNVGASSILGKVKKEHYLKAYNKSNLTTEQEKLICSDDDWYPIKMKTMRLETYCKVNQIENIDLICMDVEGVGLTVLKGLGEKINKVKYIISECDYGYTRENEDTFDDINNYLSKYNFKIIENKFQVNILSDCLWKNMNL